VMSEDSHRPGILLGARLEPRADRTFGLISRSEMETLDDKVCNIELHHSAYGTALSVATAAHAASYTSLKWEC